MTSVSSGSKDSRFEHPLEHSELPARIESPSREKEESPSRLRRVLYFYGKKLEKELEHSEEHSEDSKES